MKSFIFTLVLLSSATLLTACDNIKKNLPQAENEKSEQSIKAQEKRLFKISPLFKALKLWLTIKLLNPLNS